MNPGSQEWLDRVEAIMAGELSEPEHLIYMSFADEDGFRGAIITRAHGITTAVQKAHRLGINPGGEVMGVDIPGDANVPDEYLDRLLSKEDIKALWGDARTIRELEEEA